MASGTTPGEAPAAAPAAADALPCLFSPNSDEYREKVCRKHRKRTEATARNIEDLVLLLGTAAGFLTVTFAVDLSVRDAQRRLANFTRRVLKENFGHRIVVREFTARGRVHFHIIIDCQGDISTGFNWEHYGAVTKWSKSGRTGPKPPGKLGRTDRLAELHTLLAEKAPLYGIGRIELIPVKNAQAVGRYAVGEYLTKSFPHKPPEAKRTRCVNYSYRCPRTFKGAWSWCNEFGWLWRAKLATWAKLNGCWNAEGDLAPIKAKFGPKWAHREGPGIWNTVLHWYPDAKTANADFCVVMRDEKEVRQPIHNFPEDAVSICVAEWDEDGYGYSFPGHVDGSKEVPSPVITSARPKTADVGASTAKGWWDVASLGTREWEAWVSIQTNLYRLSKLPVPSMIEELYPEFARLQKKRQRYGSRPSVSLNNETPF